MEAGANGGIFAALQTIAFRSGPNDGTPRPVLGIRRVQFDHPREVVT